MCHARGAGSDKRLQVDEESTVGYLTLIAISASWPRIGGGYGRLAVQIFDDCLGVCLGIIPIIPMLWNVE